MQFPNERKSSGMVETATFGLFHTVTVTYTIFELIDALSDIRFFAVHIVLNCRIRPIVSKVASDVQQV